MCAVRLRWSGSCEVQRLQSYTARIVQGNVSPVYMVGALNPWRDALRLNASAIAELLLREIGTPLTDAA